MIRTGRWKSPPFSIQITIIHRGFDRSPYRNKSSLSCPAFINCRFYRHIVINFRLWWVWAISISVTIIKSRYPRIFRRKRLYKWTPSTEDMFNLPNRSHRFWSHRGRRTFHVSGEMFDFTISVFNSVTNWSKWFYWLFNKFCGFIFARRQFRTCCPHWWCTGAVSSILRWPVKSWAFLKHS